MSDANVWQPKRVLDLTNEVKSVYQKFIATEGQTVFNITDFVYAINTNSLFVYKNGLRQEVQLDFVEMSTTAFTLAIQCTVGDVISAMALVDVSVGDISDAEQAVIDSAASAAEAELEHWEAEAERMTADSYATEPEDVFVKTYASDGDGTFTATNTAEYSSLHHAAKSVTDLVTDISPQLGADLDLNGHDLSAVPPIVQTLVDNSLTAVVGAIIDYAGDTVPTGFLECDGSEVAKASYANLYAAIGDLWATTGGATAPGGTNFRIPPQEVDGLGLFNRGYGDVARPVGTYEEDAFKEHSHTSYSNGSTYNAAFSGTICLRAIAGSTGTIGDATETRPRSLTTLKCIKY